MLKKIILEFLEKPFKMQFRQFFLISFSFLLLLTGQSLVAQDGERTVVEYEARQQAIQLAQQAEENLRERERAWREAAVKREFYKDDLNQKKTAGTISKQEIKILKLELGTAEKEATALLKRVKTAELWAKETRKMIAMSKKKRDKVLLRYGIQPINTEGVVVVNKEDEEEEQYKKKLSKIERAERELAAIQTRERLKAEQPTPPVIVEKGKVTNPKLVVTEREIGMETVPIEERQEDIPLPRTNKKNEQKKSSFLVTDLPTPTQPTPKFAKYDPLQNTFLNPPIPECQVAFAGVDDFTGKNRKDLQPQILFYHTDERLKPYLKNEDYLTTQAYLSTLEGGFHFLTLIIQIASKNAQLEYGSIERGSVVSFKTLGGKTAKLQANKTDNGLYDTRTDSFIYRVQYIISGGAKKILESELIDQIRVTWSRGYEDYEIYEVDLLKRQFECLK